MAIIPGVGYLVANDILSDVSYALIQNPVNTVVPTGGILTGSQTVLVWDDSMYVGAMILVGAGTDLEVVTITAVNPQVSFTATFASAHIAGEPVTGATFPVRQPTDYFFTQAEMLQYLSTAVNDFLLACPLVYNVADATVAPTAQNAALPADCMVPMRIAVADYPLRETSQARLDGYNYRWQEEAPSQAYCYFRDKMPQQNFGIWPRANNTTVAEIVYQQRGPQVMGLADGFLIPDPFLIYVKYHVLEFAYSKDGEQRNPGLAQFYSGRYEMGVKVSNMFLAAIMDPNLQLQPQ